MVLLHVGIDILALKESPLLTETVKPRQVAQDSKQHKSKTVL